jgi:uncharacterized phage protein (TIGR01671 family)
MRDYLFRGFGNNNQKRWFYGDLRVYGKNKASIWENNTGNPVDPKSVGEFTGLIKNGVKVFEGDILKTLHFISGKKKHYLYHVVKWSKRLTGWQCINTGNIKEGTPDNTANGNPQLWAYAEAEFYVAGNVYDNPELLESKK